MNLRLRENVLRSRKKLLQKGLIFLGLTFSLSLNSTLIFGSVIPHFIVLEEGVNFHEQAQSLLKKGAVIHQKVPSRILIADIPETLDLSKMITIEAFFTSVAPISQLEPMGPLAVASGLQWNRGLLTQAQTQGTQTFAAMQSLVASQSLPAPTNLIIQKKNHSFTLDLDLDYGTSLHEIEVSKDSLFTKVFHRTRTHERRVEIPLGDKSNSEPVYLRVRRIDRGEIAKGSPALKGEWSKVRSIVYGPLTTPMDLTTPQLTSPLDGYDSEGTTVILEWAPHQGEQTRVQVSESASFKLTLIDTIVTKNEFSVPSSLLEIGKTYHWRIRGWGGQKSEWTDHRRFQISPPRHVGSDTFINPEQPR